MKVDRNATWVGVLDFDENEPVAGVRGPLQVHHAQTRVLVRVHRAPLGYVQVPRWPEETLTERIRAASEATLAGALRHHRELEESASTGDGDASWVARVVCPRLFPVRGSTGLTVVVCTRDRPANLRNCLRALRNVALEPLEILVVDNAPSTADTWEIVTAVARHDPRVRYTCEPGPGLSRARNHGLENAEHNIVAFTDDDTLADPGWPAALIAGFAADPNVVCVTGPIASAALDTGPQRYFDMRYSWAKNFEPKRYQLSAGLAPSSMHPFRTGIIGNGANFAVRRDVVIGLGGFDPLLGTGGPCRGGEDLDMLLRLILAGGRVSYLPSALVWHQHRADADALREQLYDYGHGLGAYLGKHLPKRELQMALLGSGLRHALATLGQMMHAAEASHLGSPGRRFVFTEMRGVLAGLACYRREQNRRTRLDVSIR
jgi:GT2 family glycosyltransferase